MIIVNLYTMFGIDMMTRSDLSGIIFAGLAKNSETIDFP